MAGVTINASASGVGGGTRVVMRGASLSPATTTPLCGRRYPHARHESRCHSARRRIRRCSPDRRPIVGHQPRRYRKYISALRPVGRCALRFCRSQRRCDDYNQKGEEGQTRVTISNNTTFQRVAVMPGIPDIIRTLRDRRIPQLGLKTRSEQHI